MAVLPNNKNIFSLVFTIFLDFLSFGIILPILAPVLLDPVKGILPQEYSYASRTIILGFMIGTFPMTQFFGAPILGSLSDKYGRKKILLISIAGTALSLVMFAVGILWRNVFLLFFSRAVNGITGGNVSTAQSAIADMSDSTSRARNFGLIGMAFGLGFVLGPLVGGKLADANSVAWFDYATPFWFAALLSFINVILISVWLKETLLHPKKDALISFTTGLRNVKKALLNGHFRIIFAVVFLGMFGFTFFTQFFQVYLITKFNLNQAELGELYAYIGLWIAFTQGGLTRLLSKRLPPQKIIRVSLLTLSAGLIILLVPERLSLIYLFIPLVSLSQGLTMPNVTSIVSNSVRDEEQGEILGINQSVQSVAFAMPPIIAGIVTSIDYRLPIILASGFTFLGWLLCMAYPRHFQIQLWQ